MQSRPEVVPLQQGDAVLFAVHHRPVQGVQGIYKVNLRHGVSRIRSGHRHTAPKAGCEPGCRRREDLLEVCMRAEKG
ncbi:MAG TPA: 2OG-Fe(II) oxygenase [Nitrosospira sp.]|nr:2OG-Fe(II) oxygenase [Nitrosospira sp.]